MTLDDLDVLLIMPDFASSPKITAAQKMMEVDLSEAPRINAFPSDRPLHAFTHKFRFTDRTEAIPLEDFFCERKGKHQAFYVPSWIAELCPVDNIAFGASELKVESVAYGTNYDPTDTNKARLGRYVFLISQDGQMLVRRVTASATGGGVDTLTLGEAVDRDFIAGKYFVGFLYCVRMLKDDLSLEFRGAQNIQCDVGFVELMKA